MPLTDATPRRHWVIVPASFAATGQGLMADSGGNIWRAVGGEGGCNKDGDACHGAPVVGRAIGYSFPHIESN